MLNDRLANNVPQNGMYSNGTDDDRVLRAMVRNEMCWLRYCDSVLYGAASGTIQMLQRVQNTRRGRSRAQHVQTARQTSRGRKIGTWCICDARKGCVFVQKRRKRRMARPEGPSRCFGCGSFVAERRSSGEARRAEPTSPFLWRLI